MKNRYGRRTGRKSLLIIGSVALYVIALAVLAVFFFQEEETPEPIFGSMEGRFRSDVTMERAGETLYYRENEITNYLIIGLDREDVTDISGHQHGGQADFLLVLSIDRIRRTITPVMLDRDAMVEMQTYGVFGHPSGTKVMQLCLAQAYSGVNIPGSVNTVQTVEKLLHGIDIHHYVLLDMAAIPMVNDALGGVEVTLEDDFSRIDPAMTKGATLRLMGDQAEYFVRGRMSVADGTNASRMARQQQYLSALLRQFRQEAASGGLSLEELLNTLDQHMASDAPGETLLNDINAYSSYEWADMRTLEGEHAIDEYGFAEFWVDSEALERLVADIWFTD